MICGSYMCNIMQEEFLHSSNNKQATSKNKQLANKPKVIISLKGFDMSPDYFISGSRGAVRA
jgi:hypothetical protein